MRNLVALLVAMMVLGPIAAFLMVSGVFLHDECKAVDWRKAAKAIPYNRRMDESWSAGGFRYTVPKSKHLMSDDVKLMLGPCRDNQQIMLRENCSDRPEVLTIWMYKDVALVGSDFSARPGSICLIITRE